MGTRGAYGFRIGGHDKLTYNHHDSYPEGLGFNLVLELHHLLRDRGLGQIKTEALGVVGVADPPSKGDIERWTPYTNLDVGGSTPGKIEWYNLTREAQGRLTPHLDLGQMELHKGHFNGNLFLFDSLFCEWAYIINLDSSQFEVYRGFVKTRKGDGTQGRYVEAARQSDRGYWPVELIGEIPFSAVADLANTSRQAISRLFTSHTGYDPEAEE